MPVTADWTKVADSEVLHENDYEWAVTQTLCASTFGYGLFWALGLSKLTADNIAEACARLDVINGLNLWNMRQGEEARQITHADLRRRIGLSTNYDTLTRNQWLTKRVSAVLDTLVDEYKQEVLQPA